MRSPARAAADLPRRNDFEEAWGDHAKGVHPDVLQLHVERRARNAQILTFREMCGESTFIPPAQLTTLHSIGSGSFAKVEICKYTPPGGQPMTVAVKKLTSAAALDVADFASEANILAKLKHENIVGYIGVGSSQEDSLVKHHTKSSCYMVQEYMDSGTLKQKVWSQAQIIHQVYSDHDAIQWCKQIASGLAYLHSANPLVLHRDMKLDNILLKKIDSPTRNPRFLAKICDFGLAVSLLDPHFEFRELQPQTPSSISASQSSQQFHEQMRQHVQGLAEPHPDLQAKSKALDAKLSRMSVKPSFKRGTSFSRGTLITPDAKGPISGAAVTHEGYRLTGRAGSFLYMAPEVVMSQPYNEKVDIFSLGVIMFEIFLRKPMAAILMEMDPSDNVAEMFSYKVAGGYRHPVPPDWPAELRQLIADCWQQDPERRPTAAQVSERLARLEESELFQKWETDHKRKLGKCCVVQ